VYRLTNLLRRLIECCKEKLKCVAVKLYEDSYVYSYLSVQPIYGEYRSKKSCDQFIFSFIRATDTHVCDCDQWDVGAHTTNENLLIIGEPFRFHLNFISIIFLS
jgi:hypothetical protein